MSRIIEGLKHFIVWLGRAVGLTKRPLPQPPQIPTPDAETPIRMSPGPLRFYGPFIPQWGSFDYREQVTFDFRFQVHGCGETAQKYGIKNPIKNGVLFSLVVQHVESGDEEPVFTKSGHIVGEKYVSVDRLYWIPGRGGNTAPRAFRPKSARMGCGTTIPPIQPLPFQQGTEYTITLSVKALNGQSWQWSEMIQVAGGACG